MHLILIGYRGTGKTTVAERLSRALRRPWWDADAEVERRAGCSIADIFAAHGEAGFREQERQVIADLVRGPAAVLALGGGAVMADANRQAIRGSRVIWLSAEAGTIFGRLQADPLTVQRRPQLTTGGLSEIETLLAERRPVYRSCADVEISTDGKPAGQVVDEILDWLGRDDSAAATATDDGA